MNSAMQYRLMGIIALVLVWVFTRWLRRINNPRKLLLGVVEGLCTVVIALGILVLFISCMG